MNFYITTPIYYANSLPHLGHLYTTLIGDTVKRARRQMGEQAFFLTGTDEHGINIQRAAANNNRTPQEQVDYVSGELRKMLEGFGLSEANGGYDIFMRTTLPFHYAGVQHLWSEVAKGTTPKGNSPIYKDFYEGWFCAPCAAFKTEDEYIPPATEGDPPRCLVHETPLDRVAEESYFFRLSDYGDALLELYESRPDFIRPEARRNEVLSFVRGGLQDLSVSRQKSSVAWGIPVPGDDSHTMFVWFDALSNYITALGYGNDERTGLAEFWPGTHLLGKDILRQHAIYWPAFLIAAGLEQPRAIWSHGLWLDAQGRKMSKTLGNTIDLNVLHRYFATDAIRYFVLREMAFGQDGRFSYEALIDRTNSDLASGLGNLAARTLSMLTKYCGGRIPADDVADEQRLAVKRTGLEDTPVSLAKAAGVTRDQFVSQFTDFAFHRALETAWGYVARVDKLISDVKPWVLAKDEANRPALDALLYRCAESLRWLAVLLYPVLPDSMTELWRQLGQDSDLTRCHPTELTWGGLASGTPLGASTPLFPRLDKDKIMSEIASEMASNMPEAPAECATVPPAEAAEAAASSAPAAEAKPEGVTEMIEIGDFTKIELRVAQILTAERVPKADKLLRFTLDAGDAEPRQILAGIAQHYEPEGLVGRKIVIVANLKPRKLRGFESQGMVLAASYGEDGKPVLATFTEDVPNGARLK